MKAETIMDKFVEAMEAILKCLIAIVLIKNKKNIEKEVHSNTIIIANWPVYRVGMRMIKLISRMIEQIESKSPAMLINLILHLRDKSML